MFSRICKLCQRSVDHTVVNLRWYKTSSFLRQQVELEENEKPKKKREPLVICKKSAFNFYKGKTFSKFDTIPIASQGWHHPKSIGDYFTILPDFDETQENYHAPDELLDFNQLNIHPKLLENMAEQNIHTPSDIQRLGIPKILDGEHTMISAETGVGKTLTYLLPMFHQILRWKALPMNEERPPNNPLAVIVTPSRELAEQIGHKAKKLAADLDIKIRTVTGGRTSKILRNPPVGNIDLLVGSFGVVSKMITTKVYKRHYIKHLVLDEAHALFDVTFDEKLEIFLRRFQFGNNTILDENEFSRFCQLTLVSATKAAEFPEYMGKIMDESSFTQVTTSNFHRVMVPQKFLRVAAVDKPMTLLKLVKPKAAKKHPCIVFSNTSETCDWISMFLNEFNISTIHLNGEMSMVIRKGKFAAFQRGEFMVLSATNAGARGLDTVQVNDIVNYDFPMETAEYIHRCGRTGRLGTKGECRVTNLISRRLEIELTQKIERAARRRRPLPIFDMEKEDMKAKEKGVIGKHKKGKASIKDRRKRDRRRLKKRPIKSEKKNKESTDPSLVLMD